MLCRVHDVYVPRPSLHRSNEGLHDGLIDCEGKNKMNVSSDARDVSKVRTFGGGDVCVEAVQVAGQVL